MQGKVKEKKGRGVVVEIPRVPEKCRSCAFKFMCGFEGDAARVWVPGDAPVDAEVEVELSEAKAILLSFLTFMVPVIIYIASFVLLRFKFSVGVSAGLALVPMLLWFPILNLFSSFFKPRLVR